MTMNIEQFSETEISNLINLLNDEVLRREETKRQRVIEEIASLARAHGYVLDELIAGTRITRPQSKPARTKKKTIPVKYRHPEQSDLTWTGRGIQPRLVKAWIAAGNALDAVRVPVSTK